MMTTNSHERVLAAPESLGLESRADFRQRACRLLEEMPEGEGRLVVDLRRTNRIDSAGLGALMLVQRSASARRQSVTLRHASEEIRFLLTLTRLLDLFDIDESAPTR
jgi:anti-anti-sigma factor